MIVLLQDANGGGRWIGVDGEGFTRSKGKEWKVAKDMPNKEAVIVRANTRSINRGRGNLEATPERAIFREKYWMVTVRWGVLETRKNRWLS